MHYPRWMRASPTQAIHQSFLPADNDQAYVWKYSASIGGRRPRHFHAEPELNLVVRGSATFGVGQKVITVSAGELVAFPSAQDHVLLDSTPDLYLYAIGLDRRYSSQVLMNEPSHPFHVRLASNELTPVLACAADIVERSDVGQRGAELWQRAHWLARRASPRSAHATHVLTRRALQLLRPGSDLPLTRLAQSLRAQPAEVSRHFHRNMGITLVRYRMRLKLLHFIQLVDSRHLELMAAARSAGFGSYSQCHRTFQAELDCSPREFFLASLRSSMQGLYTDPRVSSPNYAEESAFGAAG